MRAKAVLALTILFTTTPASASSTPLEWKSEWRRFQTWEWVGTGAVSAALFTSYLLAPNKPRVHGAILFDEPVRDLLVPETEAGRSRADLISYATYYSLAAYPFIGDAVFTATIARKNSDVAGQMVLMDAEAMAFNGLMFKILDLSVARARPFVADCLDQGKPLDECNKNAGVTTSMPAGHVSTAVTGAALICTHHMRLGLYGTKASDATACGVGIGVALAAAVSRAASDNHYATDVIVGSLIGVFSGWVLPTTLHYGWTSSQKTVGALPVVPFVTSTSFGAAYMSVL